jgi:hypothetical protein
MIAMVCGRILRITSELDADGSAPPLRSQLETWLQGLTDLALVAVCVAYISMGPSTDVTSIASGCFPCYDVSMCFAKLFRLLYF